jgi:hypothetical protein
MGKRKSPAVARGFGVCAAVSALLEVEAGQQGEMGGRPFTPASASESFFKSDLF